MRSHVCGKHMWPSVTTTDTEPLPARPGEKTNVEGDARVATVASTHVYLYRDGRSRSGFVCTRRRTEEDGGGCASLPSMVNGSITDTPYIDHHPVSEGLPGSSSLSWRVEGTAPRMDRTQKNSTCFVGTGGVPIPIHGRMYVCRGEETSWQVPLLVSHMHHACVPG